MNLFNSWATLWVVLQILAPLFLSAVVSAAIVYFAFNGFPKQGATVAGDGQPVDQQFDDSYGMLAGLSYAVMTSLFGVTLGALVKLLGGFAGIAEVAVGDSSSATSVFSAIAAVLIAALGIVASLLNGDGKISLRKPVGAATFLISFLISGFYFQYLLLVSKTVPQF